MERFGGMVGFYSSPTPSLPKSIGFGEGDRRSGGADLAKKDINSRRKGEFGTEELDESFEFLDYWHCFLYIPVILCHFGHRHFTAKVYLIICFVITANN